MGGAEANFYILTHAQPSTICGMEGSLDGGRSLAWKIEDGDPGGALLNRSLNNLLPEPQPRHLLVLKYFWCYLAVLVAGCYRRCLMYQTIQIGSEYTREKG